MYQSLTQSSYFGLCWWQARLLALGVRKLALLNLSLCCSAHAQSSLLTLSVLYMGQLRKHLGDRRQRLSEIHRMDHPVHY